MDEEKKGSEWLREMYELFAPVRESLKDVPEEEINAAIDAAVKEVRARKRSREIRTMDELREWLRQGCPEP
jgi:hypothetical protein